MPTKSKPSPGVIIDENRNRIVKRVEIEGSNRIQSILPIHESSQSKMQEFYNTANAMRNIKLRYPTQRMVAEIYEVPEAEYRLLVEEYPLEIIDQVSKFFYENPNLPGAVIICHKQS